MNRDNNNISNDLQLTTNNGEVDITTTRSPSNDNNSHPNISSESTSTNATSTAISSSSLSSSLLFFADATLDLSMAHDIADTPEAKRHHHHHAHDNNNIQRQRMMMMMLTNDSSSSSSQQQQQQRELWVPPLLPFGTSSTTTATTTNNNTTTSTTIIVEGDGDGEGVTTDNDVIGTTIMNNNGMQINMMMMTDGNDTVVHETHNHDDDDDVDVVVVSNDSIQNTRMEEVEEMEEVDEDDDDREDPSKIPIHDESNNISPFPPPPPPPPLVSSSVVVMSNFDSIMISKSAISNNNTNNNNSNNNYNSSSSNNIHHDPNQRIIRPKYPRDIGWVLLFIFVVPISLLYPILWVGSSSLSLSNDASSPSSSPTVPASNNNYNNNNNNNNYNYTDTTSSSYTTYTNTNTSLATTTTTNVLAHHPLSFATIHSITWTIFICLIITRYLLYRGNHTNNHSTSSMSTNQRRFSINTPVLLTTLAPVSILIYFLLTLMTFYICLFDTISSTGSTRSTGWWIILIPCTLWIREVYIYRYYLTRHTNNINDMGYISRSTFFHELYNMSIHDILMGGKSKIFISSRRTIRYISFTLLLQMMIILLWRTSLLHVLLNYNNNNFNNCIHVLYIWMIGIWCTSCVTKGITYLVSGAILLWSIEQSERLRQLQQQQFGVARNNDNNNNTDNDNNNDNDDEDDDVSSIYSRQNSIPEAYRTVDASVYQSVSFHMDDLHLEDDDDDNDIENNNDDDNNNHYDMEYQSRRFMDHTNSNNKYTYLNGRNNNNNKSFSTPTTSLDTTITMKSMIRTGLLRINLGSIIHCGFISNISQYIYTHIQYWDYIRYKRQQYRHQQQSSLSNNTPGGFQGMGIGHNNDTTNSITITNIYHRIVIMASIIRYYVQYHNDLPMTHVATYYKSYMKATRDVTSIIQESGLEPILQEDITKHICASICNTISGVIVLITTYLLLHQRNNSVNSADITELHVAETMFMSYMYSYTLLYTAFEPIRAAIHSSYIAFAQNPQCFLHSYPLIYHRLSRLSTATTAATN